MRELNLSEIAGVAGGSAVQDPNNPWFQLDKDPFNSQAEHGGVTSHFENSSGGVTTVHISGAQLHESGLFEGPNGVIYGSSGDWINEQTDLRACENWAAVMAVGGAVTIVGVAGSALGGSGAPVAATGAVIAGVGAVGYWMSGCG